MDLSARLAAAASLLVALVCIIEVAAQNGLCPPEPVVVYLSRGQKVTVRYWVGEEAQQEVTEVPKLTRRPPRPETTTASDEDLHGRLGEHNVTAALPSEDEDISTTTSAQTTVEEVDTTTTEKAHTDVTKEIQLEADEPQSDVNKEHESPSSSTESDITTAAATTEAGAEEHTVASSVAASTVSESSSDLETTVATVVASSSTTDLKHEVEYAADAESADAAHAEHQTTTSLPTEETTVTVELTSAPTTVPSVGSSVEENVTQSLLYRSPNNDSDSVPLTLEGDDNPDIVSEVSTTLAAEKSVVTEDHQSTTVTEPTDSPSTSDGSSVTTQTSTSSESTSEAVEAADVTKRAESQETSTSSENTATSEDATTPTTTEDATTPTTTEDATTPTTTENATTQTATEDATTPATTEDATTPTTTEDISTPTTAESNVSDEATNSPTTRRYREGELTVIVEEEEENNGTSSDKPTEFSLEQSFSVGNLNNSERDDSVDVHAKNDAPSTGGVEPSTTTELSETTQASSNDQSTTLASVEISTEATLETSSESSDTTTSVMDLLPKTHVETTPENAATSGVDSTTSEPTTTSEVLSSRTDGINTADDDDASTASDSEDTSEDSDSTMPPLVAGDESLFESILHQVLVANASEGEAEAKEGRKLDKDNDVYPSNDNPETINEDEPEAEEVRVATEEYLSTLAEEAAVPDDKEDSTSTEKYVTDAEDKILVGEELDLRVGEDIPAGPRRGPDPNPDWDTPVSHYAYPESSGPHGPRVYIGSRSRRDVTFASANTTLCQWIFKTDPGVPLLLTFKNFSTPDSERCVHHHIAVERSNGYEARWCGGAYESPSHATFARHEIKLRLYSEHDGGAPSGFVAEIQALDMKLLRKAVPKARPLLHHPHH